MTTKWKQHLWLWILGNLHALACAPEGDDEPTDGEYDTDEGDDAAQAGDDGPPPVAELGEAEYDAEEEAVEAEQRGDDEDDEEEEEPDEDEGDDDEEDEQPAQRPAERRTAPPDAIHADDDPDAEFNRELEELNSTDGQPSGAHTPPPGTTSPAGQLPPLAPGFVWAQDQYGRPYPVQVQQPQFQTPGYQGAQPAAGQPEFDPEAVPTYGDLQRMLFQNQQQMQRQMQEFGQRQAANAKIEAMMESHLDRFSLTRDKNSRTRSAVRREIEAELNGMPNGWTDADFARVSRKVTQDFYVERNRGRTRTKSAAAGGPAATPKRKPQTQQPRTETQRRNVRPPSTLQEEINDEVRQATEVLKKQGRRKKKRR